MYYQTRQRNIIDVGILEQKKNKKVYIWLIQICFVINKT